MDLKAILDLNTKAVKLREAGQLTEALTLFFQIESQLPSLQSSTNKSDWDQFVGLTGELFITYRHQSKDTLQKTLDKAQEVYKWAKTTGITGQYLSYAIRGISSALLDQNRYEEAEPYLKEMLANMDSQNSAYVGDTEAHLAGCLLRQGKLEEAKKIITGALQKIDQNMANMDAMPTAVWKSHALLVKALIVNSEGNKQQAIAILEEALTLAKSKNLSVRISEISSKLAWIKS